LDPVEEVEEEAAVEDDDDDDNDAEEEEEAEEEEAEAEEEEEEEGTEVPETTAASAAATIFPSWGLRSQDRVMAASSSSVSRAQTFTVLSMPHDARQLPRGWMSIDNTSSRCPRSPAKTATQRCVSTFHIRIDSSLLAEKTMRMSSGWTRISFTELPWPTSPATTFCRLQSMILIIPRSPPTRSRGVPVMLWMVQHDA
jgi:hypothetical protein